MKTKFSLISYFLLTASFSLNAANMWLTNGTSADNQNRIFENANNWSKTEPTASPYYNIDPAGAYPGVDDMIFFANSSGNNGSTSGGNIPRITISGMIPVGTVTITNRSNIPLQFYSSDGGLVFNTKNIGEDIIKKDRNIGEFNFVCNIEVLSTGRSSVRVTNRSDNTLRFQGSTFKIASGSPTVIMNFYQPQRAKPDQWTAYSMGDIEIYSSITSSNDVIFYSDYVTDPRNARGSFWLKGSTSNKGYFHLKNNSRMYLDKTDGADAISNGAFYLGWRSEAILMRDNQINDNVTVQFKTPWIDTAFPSDITGILNLNGFSERIKNIEFWNDNGSPKQGLRAIIDFGDGGAQTFIFAGINFQISNTTFSGRVYRYRTFVEFYSYRQGEDHVYSVSKLSSTTFTNDAPGDTSTKTLVTLLRFPEFGVYDVDYTVSETAVSVNGESMYEYAPVAK